MADKEYIERGALKNVFCNACSTHKRYHRTFDECRNKIDTDGNRCFKMRLIDNAPTADVVEVVRCKDCRLASESIMIDGWFKCANNNMTHKPDHFCSYGERKDK